MSDKTTMTAVKQVHPESSKPPFPSMVWIPGGVLDQSPIDGFAAFR